MSDISATASPQLEVARAVADTVLFEGYLLYPYRASATKNKYRFQFGVLFDPGYVSANPDERSQASFECLFEPRRARRLLLELRFLQLFRRWPEVAAAGGCSGGANSDEFRPVERVELADRALVPFEDAEVRSLLIEIPLSTLPGGDPISLRRTFTFSAERHIELVDERSLEGRPVRLIKESSDIAGEIELQVLELDAPSPLRKLVASVRNTGSGREMGRDRSDALSDALIGCHVIMGVEGGRFVSLLDPAQWVTPWVGQCRQDGWFPVLAGPAERDDSLLVSPILLYDHPVLAPESPLAMFDGTEIDEILALRTHALTEEEKREVRGTDPRAAELMDAVDGLPQEVWDRLHGAIRYLKDATGPVSTGPASPPVPWWDPGADPSASPETDCVVVGGTEVRKGSYVTLAPCPGADAQDIFLAGRVGVVQAVFFDLENRPHLAVALEDDPGMDLTVQEGRYLYFRPDEVVPFAEFDR
jgi:hypothetical protein